MKLNQCQVGTAVYKRKDRKSYKIWRSFKLVNWSNHKVICTRKQNTRCDYLVNTNNRRLTKRRKIPMCISMQSKFNLKARVILCHFHSGTKSGLADRICGLGPAKSNEIINSTVYSINEKHHHQVSYFVQYSMMESPFIQPTTHSVSQSVWKRKQDRQNPATLAFNNLIRCAFRLPTYLFLSNKFKRLFPRRIYLPQVLS